MIDLLYYNPAIAVMLMIGICFVFQLFFDHSGAAQMIDETIRNLHSYHNVTKPFSKTQPLWFSETVTPSLLTKTFREMTSH